jgi:hypothetical protein
VDGQELVRGGERRREEEIGGESRAGEVSLVRYSISSLFGRAFLPKSLARQPERSNFSARTCPFFFSCTNQQTSHKALLVHGRPAIVEQWRLMHNRRCQSSSVPAPMRIHEQKGDP